MGAYRVNEDPMQPGEVWECFNWLGEPTMYYIIRHDKYNECWVYDYSQETVRRLYNVQVNELWKRIV